MRQNKPKPGAQEVLPLFPELPMPCAQRKAPAGPTSAGANRTDQCPKSGRHHGGVLVTVNQLAGGRFFFFHASDKWLIKSGLIASRHLPRQDIGHLVVINSAKTFGQAVRLHDGNVGLTIDANEARGRDKGFLTFLDAIYEKDALQSSEATQAPGGERRGN